MEGENGLEILARKTRTRLRRFIRKFPTAISIYRDVLDKRHQPTGERILVCKLTGFFHENKTILDDRNHYSDKGQARPKKNQYVMVSAEGDALFVQEGDYLTIRGIQYKITDTGNENNFDIYLDFGLERWGNDNL